MCPINRYPGEQRSTEVYLASCFLYWVKAFSRESYRNGHLSVGLESPGGILERPLQGNKLYWLLPGTE